MPDEPVVVLVVVLTLTGVLLTSGAAKLRDRRATRDAFDALRVPAVLAADASATALPWVEIALGTLLLVAPKGWLVPVALVVLMLMISYTWLIARALTFDEPVTCSCFGSLGRHDVDGWTLGRNMLLVVLAALITWFALNGDSASSAFSALDMDGWWTLASAAAAAAVAVLVGGAASAPNASVADELLDYERQPIPYGVVSLADGRTATLAELARTQARLVVILNRSCGPCIRVEAKLDEWAARLAPSVGVLAVYPAAADVSHSTFQAPELAAWEPDHNLRRVFDVHAPAAIVLGADGLLAGGPVAGEDAVVELVEAVLEELGGPSA